MLPSVELAAARLLSGHAPESVLSEATSQDDFERSRNEGHLWVALSDDVPIGFAQVKILEPRVAHLDEIDVHPEHGRRGIGTRLVKAVCEWAALMHTGLSRSQPFEMFDGTCRSIPKLGFEVIPREILEPRIAFGS